MVLVLNSKSKLEDFYGDSDSYIFVRNVLPLPEITNIVARQFPDSELVQGDTFSVDLNNVRPTIPNDVGMTYTCTFVQNHYTDTPNSGSCSDLDGTVNLTADGNFTWITDSSTHGSFDLTFTGTDANGKSDIKVRRFNIRAPYEDAGLIADYDMSFSSLTEPARNGTTFTSTLKSLVSSGDDGSLNNFDTAGSWNGDEFSYT